MRPLLATIAMMLVTSCAYQSVTFNEDEAFSSVVKPSNALIESISGRSPEYDHGADFGVFRAEPLLERMPFGASMSGPWDSGGGLDSSPGFTVAGTAGRMRTILHRLAMQAKVSIIVEGALDGDAWWIPKSWLDGEAPKELALARIQSICKANKLDYIHDGDFVIIKKRPQELALAHVVLSELDGHYDVSFDDHELVAAIMEVAAVTKTQVFVPALRVDERNQPPEEDKEAGLPIESVKITLHMRAALPERILRRLAELGGMEIEELTLEDSADGANIGYKFTYRK